MIVNEKLSTIDELMKYGDWDDESTLNIFEVYVYSNLFSKTVKTYTIYDDKSIASNHLTLLNDFLSLDESLLSTIKEKLWEHCEFLFYMVDYGAEFEGQTNYEFFDIFTPDDAYANANLDSVVVDTEENVCQIQFYPEWEDHGFIIQVVDGKLIFEPYDEDIYKEFAAYRENVERRSDKEKTSIVEEEEEVEEKAQILKNKLDEYKAIKKQRNPREDTTGKLLAYPSVKKEAIDEELLSSLEGNWYKEFIYIEGDFVLNGDLDIDALHSHADGLIINGNLKVNGGIYNLEGDYGIALIVSGDVVADFLVGGGSEIYLLGHTHVYSFVVGHYNHGILNVNDINAAVEVNSDHHSETYGEIAYTFDDYNFSYDELGKIYTNNKNFIEIEYDEDEKYYSVDIDGFNNELLQGDEVLLEALLEHFLERENLLKFLKTASINNDELEVIKIKENLENYVSKYEADNYEYDDWDDENDEWEEESSESPYNFKLYDLTEIEALNNEIDDSGLPSNTWWGNIKLLLSKEGLRTIGLLSAKIKYITTSSLDDIQLKDRDDTLVELEKFSSILHNFYKKEQSIRLSLLAFILLLLWFYPQSIILYIFLTYYAYQWYKKYINFSIYIKWIDSAKAYTKHAKIDSENTEDEASNSLDDTLTFIRYTTKQDKENWSVKLFDFIANLFKGKRY